MARRIVEPGRKAWRAIKYDRQIYGRQIDRKDRMPGEKLGGLSSKIDRQLEKKDIPQIYRKIYNRYIERYTIDRQKDIQQIYRKIYNRQIERYTIDIQKDIQQIYRKINNRYIERYTIDIQKDKQQIYRKIYNRQGIKEYPSLMQMPWHLRLQSLAEKYGDLSSKIDRQKDIQQIPRIEKIDRKEYSSY